MNIFNETISYPSKPGIPVIVELSIFVVLLLCAFKLFTSYVFGNLQDFSNKIEKISFAILLVILHETKFFTFSYHIYQAVTET